MILHADRVFGILKTGMAKGLLAQRVVNEQAAERGLFCPINGHAIQKETSAGWVMQVAGNCDSPVRFAVTGRPARVKAVRPYIGKLETRTVNCSTKETERPFFVDIEARCRTCASCMKARKYMWTQRAIHEIQKAPRTFLCTLTLHPDAKFHMEMRARVAASERGIDPSVWTPEERYNALVSQFMEACTLWLKRVRSNRLRYFERKYGVKHKGAFFRYVVVAERHKSGDPHLHLLIHEIHGAPTLATRFLRDESDEHPEGSWYLGFAKAKVVKTGTEPYKVAKYVAKYVGKECSAKLRASLRYGRTNVATQRSSTIVPQERETHDLMTGDTMVRHTEKVDLPPSPSSELTSESVDASQRLTGVLEAVRDLFGPSEGQAVKPRYQSKRAHYYKEE